MTAFVNELRATTAAGGIARIMNPVSRFGPRIMLAPDADGNPTAEEVAAAATAETTRLAVEAEATRVANAETARLAAEAIAAAESEAARIAAEATMTEAEREKAANIREIMDKKAKLKVEKARADAAEAELAKYKGIDIEVAKKAIADKATKDAADLEAKGEFARVKQMLIDERNAEKAVFEKQIADLTAAKEPLVRQIDELTLGQNFTTSAFIAEDLVLTPTKARILYGSHFEFKDGKTIAYDKPAGSAGRTPLEDAGGQPLSFDAAMKKIIDADPERDSLLKAKIKPGAHSKSGDLPNKGASPKEDGLYGVGRILASFEAGK